MNRSPIVLDTASSVAQDNQRRVRGLGRGPSLINKLQSPLKKRKLGTIQCIFPACLKCNTHQSTPDHLLSCMELEKRNLFESPAQVLDFLWASGLLDLV
ncbi:hypothetical protein AVEN_141297-1 [Araneus ventricosus]|uniref:Uncharacterized protein n=1 Tax=Araneus ventricosus TaxID=182803 RepID=A0A4Y2V340_ARAVE|nr:hypothetical protein AVEN_112228-1 [Araneus ventricosus]GBO18158.1 hypothetical protein AVEN_141297-1 [Araneus ventricosus]